MDNIEVRKGEMLINAKIIDYVANSVIVRTILKKPTGNVSVISFDKGEIMHEKIIPFDNFIEIIEGKAEIVIDGISNTLIKGQSIIIPAHTLNYLKANERFKMISTIIKSGYEDLS